MFWLLFSFLSDWIYYFLVLSNNYLLIFLGVYVVLNASFRFLIFSSIDFWDISNHGFLFLMLLSLLNSSSAVIFMLFDNQFAKLFDTIHHNSPFLLQYFWTSNCWASVNKLKSTQEVCSMYFFLLRQLKIQQIIPYQVQ